VAKIEQPDRATDPLVAALISKRHELLAEPFLERPHSRRKKVVAEPMIANTNDPAPFEIDAPDRRKEVDVLPPLEAGIGRTAPYHGRTDTIGEWGR
jgi:hypothetical protein